LQIREAHFAELRRVTDIYSFVAGDSPLLVSIPHDGCTLAPGMAERITDEARELPDTDWQVARLYGFAESIGASVLRANYSRYVVDLNRAPDDDALYAGQVSTGLCPTMTFAGQPIYRDGELPGDDERASRVESYWRPYHDRLGKELSRLRGSHGFAMLWDAHSIAAEVPALFDGQLPDLNIGTFDGNACAAAPENAVFAVAAESRYSSVLNGRFKGGYITRHYGNPPAQVHAIQLELSQSCYLQGPGGAYLESAAAEVGTLIESMLSTFITTVSKLGS